MSNNLVVEITRQFNATIDHCETFCFVTRAIELQEEAVRQIEPFLQQAEKAKGECVKDGNEDAANLIFGLQLSAISLKEQLNMWIELKRDNPDKAWDYLVNAKTSARAAMRAHKTRLTLQNYYNRLCAIEETVFPPQVFASAGFKVIKSKCSICNKGYGICNHLVGMPYMGQMCTRIIEEAEIQETSIVKNPDDKRCRITSFSDNGKWRNRMTWRLTQEQESAPERTARMIVCSNIITDK
jgi:hypothetical protein